MSLATSPRTGLLSALTLLLTLLVVVPSLGAQAPAEAEVQEPPTPTGQVNLNTASAEELQRLPGVGPSRAVAILEYRERHPFRRIEELMRIRGIGRATFRRLRPLLSLEGPTTLPPR